MEQEFYRYLLLFLLFGPVLIIPLLLIVKRQWVGSLTTIWSGVLLALSLVLYKGYLNFAPAHLTQFGDYLFKSSYYWFGEMDPHGFWYSRYDIKLIFGVDGLSIYLVLLTVLLFFLASLFSLGSVKKNVKSYYILLLLLETSVLGVFLSLDLFLFYLFFEIGLIPMYFLIGLWGGERRIFAALKFFLYTFVGSVLFLISILYLGYYVGNEVNEGIFTTDLAKIMAVELPRDIQFWLFWGFAISFLIKVPVFPVHTWLPLAHTEAPTAGSVILAGVLLKMGTYALMRFNLPLFPEASLFYANTMAFLGLVGILYGAMAAMMQPDIKKLIAYSSVAHMGFIVMGIFSFRVESLNGAVLQMINHGLSTGALFFIVGMIYDRTHTRLIKDYQGIAKVMPVFTFFFMWATLASIGMPGLNGFVGEFLILLGSYSSEHLDKLYPILGTSGVIVAAVYMLWMFRRVMFGELRMPVPSLADLCFREILVLIPLSFLMLWIGLGASHFLEQIHLTNQALLGKIDQITSNLVTRL